MPAPVTVCYNGSCPVCRAEIGHYQGIAGADLAWRDVAADPGFAARYGLEGDAPLRRLHAVTPDGRLLAGLDAFAAVWERLPRYRLLARIVCLPLVRPLAGLIYERVAAPILFATHRRRQARGGGR